MSDVVFTSSSVSIETSRRSHLAAGVEAWQRRPIVLVLGMHRSGTSLCSHILSVLGVDMADKIPGPGSPAPGPDNPRGHWERWEIVEFHDRILSFFNRGYSTLFHDLPLPVAWWADPRVAQVRREIVEFLKKRVGECYFGFKDPRTVRLMPIWHQIFKELRWAPKIVFCLRNPAQVARSLMARDMLDADVAEYRWFSYVADFFRYTNRFDICTVEYEAWFDEPSTNLGKLRRFLNLHWDQTELDLDLTISSIVDQALRHDDPARREAGQPLVRSFYRLASRAGHDTAAREQIQFIVSQFITFQQLQRPLHHAFENAAALAAALPGIEEESAVLHTALSERDAMVDAANRRASSAEERLAGLVTETEAHRAHIAVIERERGELSGALETARAEVAAARSALAETEHQSNSLQAVLAEREAALEGASLRAGELAAALAEREAALEGASLRAGELAAALAEREAALEGASLRAGELAAALAEREAALEGASLRAGELTATLQATQAECARMAERAAVGEASRSEARSLRRALAEAEQHGAAANAAVETLQGEITALRSELAAARDVGRAALASLRSDAPMLPAAGNPGWVTVVLRHIGLRARDP